MLRPLTRRVLISCTKPIGPKWARQLSSLPLSITPSGQELDSKALSRKNVQLSTRALHRDGVVVIENVIGHDVLDALNQKMTLDALTLQSAGEKSPYNYNRGNIQQDPPLTTTYFCPSIFLNPLVSQVTSAILGPRPQLAFISGNTALPPMPGCSSQSQPVHSDADFKHPDCPFALVVNIPLVDMTPKNGSTEMWLGTHNGLGIDAQEGKHGERSSGRIRQELLEEQAKIRPGSQPVVRKGSVVIRDLRLWHAGKPNLSGIPRVMLALIHFAQWYENPMKVEFSNNLRPILEEVKDELQVQAQFVTEKHVSETYLDRPYGNAYDFDQVEHLEGIF